MNGFPLNIMYIVFIRLIEQSYETNYFVIFFWFSAVKYLPNFIHNNILMVKPTKKPAIHLSG